MRRSVGHRIDDEAGSSRPPSDSSRSDLAHPIDWEPFDLELEISEQEVSLMQDAFKRYMDPDDKKISFNELFHDLRAIDI